MQKGQLSPLQFIIVQPCSSVKMSPPSSYLTLFSLFVSLRWFIKTKLIECQGIIYKTKDRTESWKRMGWARCESTPDSIPTIGNTRIESRAQDPQRSSRLFRWMGSFAWKFCKPAASLVPWPGALVPLRAFTLTWIDVLVVACPSNHYCIITICSSTAAAPDKNWTSINHHTL